MKIAYVALQDMGQESGINKKIKSQLESWSAAGNPVKLFALSPTPVAWAGLHGIDVHTLPPGSLVQRLSAIKALVDQVISWSPDIVYLRFGTYYPPFRRLLAEIPTVVEINTDDLAEFRLMYSWAKFTYHRLTRGFLLSNAAGLVLVTREMERQFRAYGRKMVSIGNSIRLSDYQVVSPTRNCRPRLVFIGSPGYPWHGVDKMMDLAARTPAWDFDLVGYSESDLPGAIPPNVVLHGYLGRTQYEELMVSADVGIGTLGLHRKGMSEASPLKVREYLAYGLPIIIGYTDTDIDESAPFALQLGNYEANVSDNVESIAHFVNTWHGTRVQRAHVSHLDVSVKERQRLSFFSEILHSLR